VFSKALQKCSNRFSLQHIFFQLSISLFKFYRNLYSHKDKIHQLTLFFMNTRRKFLRNSGIVASAVLAFDPLTSIASSGYFSSGTDSARNTDSIILLHTNHSTAEDFSLTAAGTGALAGRADNIVLVNASNVTSHILSREQESKKLHSMIAGGYSAALATSGDMQTAEAEQRYTPFVLSNAAHTAGAVQPSRIITKGNIKIGIIGTAALQSNAINSTQIVQEVNRLAKGLKEENGCKLVVCLSSLGYKTTGAIDDARLAKDAVNVDVIISANNSTGIKPHVALTNTGNEVLIDNAGNATTGVGKLEIGFDASGNKNFVAFGSQVLSGSAASVAIN
jgi:hypothetical protein